MGNIVNRVFESAGPDGKVRGTPQQIIDKYQALARDAQLAGDRVAAENHLQHSEHYSRMLGEAQRSQGEQQRFGQDRDDQQQPRDDQQQPMRHDQQPMRHDEPVEMPRQQPVMQAPLPSGLTTIEPEDSDDFGGPIETPEGSHRAPVRAEEPAPQVAAYPQPVFEPPSAPEAAPVPDAPAEASAETPAPPAKRPRVRRKAKVEPEPVSDLPAEQV